MRAVKVEVSEREVDGKIVNQIVFCSTEMTFRKAEEIIKSFEEKGIKDIKLTQDPIYGACIVVRPVTIL